MPELPDILAYVQALEARVVGHTLLRIRLGSPFVLRSVDPRPQDVEARRVLGVRRLGKRIVLELEGEHFIVIHLMIAGRLRWRRTEVSVVGKMQLAAFDFDNGCLVLTEASTRKRAAVYLVAGKQGLLDYDRGGLEILETDLGGFRAALMRENHTLKRSLTDPRIFSGIGNAYSDEILHCARLSPAKWTSRLTEEETERLYAAARNTLSAWIERLGAEAADGFPEKVTAFRDGMAVHGRYGKPCPVCGSPVQRIVYAENEANYCATCQTDGRLLADRSLSRLLKGDWPKTLAELEERRAANSR